MTDKELLQQALDALISVWNSDRTTRQVETIRAIKTRLTQPDADAVAIEREACAKVCDKEANLWNEPFGYALADAIRRRGKE